MSRTTRVNNSPWIRKPLWVTQEINSSGASVHDDGDDDDQQRIHRHLTLFDLVCVGVGGTIGSGIFVLCGLISHQYAGPATFISWAIAGLAACLSGACFAELSGRIPTAGSSYIYSYVAIGELPAFLSAACLTLEYIVAGAAVARSWGDKVVEFFTLQLHFSQSDMVIRLLNPGWVNPMAFVVSAVSVSLLAGGIKESKRVTNLMSSAKVLLVVTMTVSGFLLFNKQNFTPFVPKQYGIAGIFRGATSSFFGFIGYDEVCCLSGEAINPRENLPKAVLWVIAIVTILYMTASISLIGMQPYEEISETSGFPFAFQSNGMTWAAHIFAAGEVLTLPIVVLISLMAQPRLLYALAQDGLLPPYFGRIDSARNFRNGTLVSGISMTLIAAFVPFTYLNDLISAGILVAFTMTNSSLLLLRRSSPEDSSCLLEKLLVVFHVLSFLLAVVIRQNNIADQHHWMGDALCTGTSIALIGVVVVMAVRCKERSAFGRQNDQHSEKEHAFPVVYFQTPFLPYLPLAGSFVNWYLLAQLESSGIFLLLLYFALSVIGYYSYGYNNSLLRNTTTQRWDYVGIKTEAVVVSPIEDDTFENHDILGLQLGISMPRVDYSRKDIS